MASPLGWFRRNQKGMLIFFGAILMAVFGLGSVVSSLLQTSGGGSAEADKVVVRYDGGKYTRRDFQNYRNRHAQTLDFVEEVRRVAIGKVGVENYRPTAPRFTPIRFDRPESSDREIMRRMTMMRLAEEMGVSLNDEAVIDYLRGIANNDDTLQPDYFKQLAFDVYGVRGDFTQLKKQLKHELTINLMQTNVLAAGLPRSPNLIEAYEDFLKLNHRRAAAVVKVPVQDYLAMVSGDPTLPEQRAIFAEGQYDYPTLDHMEPGFKTFRKIKVGVFSSNYEDFVTSAVAAVTPEEIQAKYEELVEAKSNLVMELVPTEEASDVENKSDGEDAPPEMNLEGEGEPAESKPASDGKKADGKKADGKKAEGETTEGESTQGDRESEEGDGGEEQDDGLPLAGPTAAAIQEKQDEKQEGAKEAQGSQESAEANNQQKDTDPPAESESETPPVATTGPLPAEQDQPPVLVPPSGNLDDLLGDMQLGGEKRVKELDEALSKLIAREIASTPAFTSMSNAIREASTEISEYSQDMLAYETTKDLPMDDRQPKPEPIDPSAIARSYKIQYQETDLMDLLQLRESTIGKKMVAIQTRDMFGRASSDGQPLAVFMFSRYNEIELWQPEEFIEFRSDNQNAAFVIEKANPVIREFDEAKDDVVKYWRYNQAVALAKAEAQRMADELNANDASIIEQYPAKATELGEFTFNGRMQLYPVLPGEVEASEDFMDVAFSVDKGKAGAATDQLRENAYVIQVTALDNRTDEELRKSFFDEMSANTQIGRDLFGLYEGDTGDFFRTYFENVEKDMNIQWLTH